MKHYAVVCGRQPGIYTDWLTTESMVNGYPGAIFKSFYTKREAEAFILKSTSNPKQNVAIEPSTLPLIDKNIIYTDGVLIDNVCGFGVIIIASNGDKITAYGKVPLPSNNIVAKLYAIYVGLSLVKGNAILYSDSKHTLSSITDYMHEHDKYSVIPNRELIVEINRIMRDKKITSLQSNNYEVSELAKLGTTVHDNLIVTKNGNTVNISE